jgi:hypothetical protein
MYFDIALAALSTAGIVILLVAAARNMSQTRITAVATAASFALSGAASLVRLVTRGDVSSLAGVLNAITFANLGAMTVLEFRWILRRSQSQN